MRIKSNVDGLRMGQTAREKTGRDKNNQRSGHLSDHQNISDGVPAAIADQAAAAFAKRLIQIRRARLAALASNPQRCP